MASKARVLNDSGNKIAVFTDVGGAATSVKLTVIDVDTDQVVLIAGITAIKTLRDFLSERIRETDTERNLQNGS